MAPEEFEKIDYNTRLKITGYIMKILREHAQEGGSYRYLIYDRLGFNEDAYIYLQDNGGLYLHNILYDKGETK